MLALDELLQGYTSNRPVSPQEVESAVNASGRVLIVLDDDPTGTQSVADLPVLTSWEVNDFRWAFGLRIGARRAPAVYVLTNTRSLHPNEAAARNREVVTAALQAADEHGVRLGFVSRGDSTLRGHYPLEPDVIAATLAEHSGVQVDGVLLVPAFPEAGRVTVNAEHFLVRDGFATPVAETEFARDASFGFSRSHLPNYIEEKSEGTIRAKDVIVLNLDTIRAGTDAISKALQRARASAPIVADAVTEDDLRALALGLEDAEAHGQSFVYRVGPPFVRARIGQQPRSPLSTDDVFQSDGSPSASNDHGGLIVVGSHVAMTTRQLRRLTESHPHATTIEIDVEGLLRSTDHAAVAAEVTERVTRALLDGDVILQTSRSLVKTEDPAESLRIARTVSEAVVTVVNLTLHAAPPRFVIAKGGITSSDVATRGLEIRRAIVRGSMLPGIVSLWEALEGPATGIPYIVFAGNVGDDDSLLDVTRKLSRFVGR